MKEESEQSTHWNGARLSRGNRMQWDLGRDLCCGKERQRMTGTGEKNSGGKGGIEEMEWGSEVE